MLWLYLHSRSGFRPVERNPRAETAVWRALANAAVPVAMLADQVHAYATRELA